MSKARVRQDFWRAGCTTKGASPVRRAGVGNGRWRHRTAPTSDSVLRRETCVF
jgi:hypothetical protein